MSTGISISSINRIKELAEEQKFEEALEILDTQNLEKSINPQFLRISGEIFRENKRYFDSRKILLKAHQMSPQGLRIISELIQLYLELGYFTKANRYYEQFLFYVTPEDVQKDYVEYIIKKGNGADIKELASILIPILERMPEDKWNFEAVLLYDKMGRKDKALDECRYILEHFKDSKYVQPVIDYIDEKLNVDEYFHVYPDKEIQEDEELYGELIELENKLLESDHLRMYPPEPTIMVEAEDKEALEIKSPREKKKRKRKKKVTPEENVQVQDEQVDLENQDAKDSQKIEESKESSEAIADNNSTQSDDNATEPVLSEEEIAKNREEELEKILAKKTNTEQIKESAKQVAQAMKEIDTTKAKEQVKVVADAVKGNVKKATDVLGEAVGVKHTEEKSSQTEVADAEILDGIIESVLEVPQKSVGQVVTNEELDALVPESLEALSEDEVVEIRVKKAEEERIELEVLEAQLRAEEEKKEKKEKKSKKHEDDQDVIEVNDDLLQGADEDTQDNDDFVQLKEMYLSANEQEEEEQAPESLGFISVVQSDVDEKIEEEVPFVAGILHQMIDNKEFYSGEDSTRFETKASYENHGFDVEDYEFVSFENSSMRATHEELYNNAIIGENVIPKVEVIYAQETVVDFDDILPKDIEEHGFEEHHLENDSIEDSKKEPIDAENLEMTIDAEKSETIINDEKPEVIIEDESSWSSDVISEKVEWESVDENEGIYETATVVHDEAEWNDDTAEEQNVIKDLEILSSDNKTVDIAIETEQAEDINISNSVVTTDSVTTIGEQELAGDADKNESVEEAKCFDEPEMKENDTLMEDLSSLESHNENTNDIIKDERQQIRFRIIITESMMKKLVDVKDSR